MPTPVYQTNGTLLTTVADQTIDAESTSVALLGIGSVNFSQAIAENFVHLVENFSASSAPRSPLPGQLWYNNSSGALCLYNGSTWATIGGANGNDTGTVPGGSGILTIAGNTTTKNRFAGTIGYSIVYGAATTTVAMTLAEGKIIHITSSEDIPVTALPTTIVVNGSSYLLKTRFPAGLSAGVTMATDTASYVFAGRSEGSTYT